MDADHLLLRLGDDGALLLQTTDDAVDGVGEVDCLHRILRLTGGDQCRLIADVGNVCTGESRRLAGHLVRIHVGCQLEPLHVDEEDLLPLIEVGQVNVDLSVKAAGTHECLVEDVGTVGSRHDDDSAIGVEAVHLSQQLIEGILPLVVASEAGILSPRATDGIDLIDEDDAGTFLLCRAEEISNAAGSHADKHLYEV